MLSRVELFFVLPTLRWTILIDAAPAGNVRKSVYPWVIRLNFPAKEKESEDINIYIF